MIRIKLVLCNSLSYEWLQSLVTMTFWKYKKTWWKSYQLLALLAHNMLHVNCSSSNLLSFKKGICCFGFAFLFFKIIFFHKIDPRVTIDLFCDWQTEALLQRVHTFVLELQALKVPEVRRAPYLAELGIEKRRLMLTSSADSADAPSARLAQSILTYFQRCSWNLGWHIFPLFSSTLSWLRFYRY